VNVADDANTVALTLGRAIAEVQRDKGRAAPYVNLAHRHRSRPRRHHPTIRSALPCWSSKSSTRQEQPQWSVNTIAQTLREGCDLDRSVSISVQIPTSDADSIIYRSGDRLWLNDSAMVAQSAPAIQECSHGGDGTAKCKLYC
jgi:hypothetical protein